MTTPILRRAIAATALAASAGLLLPASPASALLPAEGHVSSFGYGFVNDPGCTISQPDNVQASRTISSATGARTATAAERFHSNPTGDPTVAASGRVVNESTGLVTAPGGTFAKAVLSAEQTIRIANLSSTDCKMGINADTQSTAEFRVRGRGRVRIEWDRSRAGQIEQIFVFRSGAGSPIIDLIRPRAHGEATFRVRRGSYGVFVQFMTRLNETDLADGVTRTKRATFRLLATRL